MTYLVVSVPKSEANGKTIDDLFPEEITSKIPTSSEIELIEKPKEYVLQTNLGTLPDKKELRVTLANIDIYLSEKGIPYNIWVGVEILNIQNLFYKASKGKDVNGSIEKELDKVYATYGRL